MGLLIAPLVCGGMGAVFERYGLRRVHSIGARARAEIFTLVCVVDQTWCNFLGRTNCPISVPDCVETLPRLRSRGTRSRILNS